MEMRQSPMPPERINPANNPVWSLAIASALILILLTPMQLICEAQGTDQYIEIPAEVLRDKIRGGLLGQILGNLNGLPHEMKYINEPGNVSEYTPALADGARTDDDTDLEWVYIVQMQQRSAIMLSPEQIVSLWKQRINKRIWCSNQYARQLMDIGFKPPLTGNIVFNPWADFNISGQFVCETFALLAPAMPEVAARIGLNYTTVTISGEPAQTTQLFTSMIATAFVSDDIEEIIKAGLVAIDPQCQIRQIVNDVRRWYSEHPDDWRAVRELVRDKYSLHNGAMRDKNGHELNTASTIAALLYGRGDFAETLRIAFNFGWDADNNAATSGTIIGVMKGYRWMMAQGWQIVDRYRNTTREDMPIDETITSFADRIIDLAEAVIVDQGEAREASEGRVLYRIPVRPPQNVLPLASVDDETARLRAGIGPRVKAIIRSSNKPQELAFAAYAAICLDMAEDLRHEHPARWAGALEALANNRKVIQVLFFESPVEAGDRLREKAIKAGLDKPTQKVNIW